MMNAMTATPPMVPTITAMRYFSENKKNETHSDEIVYRLELRKRTEICGTVKRVILRKTHFLLLKKGNIYIKLKKKSFISSVSRYTTLKRYGCYEYQEELSSLVRIGCRVKASIKSDDLAVSIGDFLQYTSIPQKTPIKEVVYFRLMAY